MRIQKYLSRAGVASRRQSEELVAEGRVRVNGVLVTAPGSRVDPDDDTVEVDGRPVSLPDPRWILVHKPPGVLTTADDPHGRPTVYDLLPSGLRSLRYVGRLDMDTEGLLVLTNQGGHVHRLLHPSFEVEREYEVEVEGVPDGEDLERLRGGVELGDGVARAVRARLLGETDEGARLALVLAEGRKREVRRMCQAVGHPVRRLRRVRFGPQRLGDLAPGEWRDLTEEEIRALRDAPG